MSEGPSTFSREITPVVLPVDLRRMQFEELASLFKIPATFDEVISPKRSRHLAQVRYILWWALAHAKKKRGLTEIGRMYHRDHSTVCVGIKKVETLLNNKNSKVNPKKAERLKLLSEAALALADNQALSDDLLQRIATHMAKEAPARPLLLPQEEVKAHDVKAKPPKVTRYLMTWDGGRVRRRD